jgi:hypothetical protein
VSLLDEWGQKIPTLAGASSPDDVRFFSQKKTADKHTTKFQDVKSNLHPKDATHS